jgi:phage repressor protein C with HTH and peptisase S24 domain
VSLSTAAEEHAFALEISCGALKPAYRDGDVIVVSPGTPVRRGDRVVVKTTGGEVIVGELQRRTTKTLELASLHPDEAEQTLSTDDVAWIARVMWVRQ